MRTLIDVNVRKSVSVISSFTDTECIILIVIPRHDTFKHHAMSIGLMVSSPMHIIRRRVFLYKGLNGR